VEGKKKFQLQKENLRKSDKARFRKNVKKKRGKTAGKNSKAVQEEFKEYSGRQRGGRKKFQEKRSGSQSKEESKRKSTSMRILKMGREAMEKNCREESFLWK